MKKIFFIILVTIISSASGCAKNLVDSSFGKTGWLIYYHGHVIWFEAKLDKNPMNEIFFLQSEYKNGLIVDYIHQVNQFKSIAKEYAIDVFYYDSTSKKTDYFLKDSICILPVKVKLRTRSAPVSDLLKPQGLSFRKNKEITMTYNFEANYDILEVQLLRKKDKNKIKRVKNNVEPSPNFR